MDFRSPRSSHHPCAGWLASLGRVAPARAGAAAGVPPDEWNITTYMGELWLKIGIYGMKIDGIYVQVILS